MKKPAGDAAYRDSAAARMLSDGLASAARERGLSQRSLAKRLGYKQSVVLSHMALGRVPIPLERTAELADVLLLDKREFLRAVLAQRLPEIDWSEIIGRRTAQGEDRDFVSTLETIAHGALENLNLGQQAVMREVASDRYAEERWLSVHEVPTVSLLRSLRPNMVSNGLSVEDREAIRAALIGHTEREQPSSSF